MLDKKDFKTIETLMQKALTEFFDTLVLPYFEHNEQDHKEIKETLADYDREMDLMQRKLDRNQDEHDEIFVKLDSIEKHVINHERRIKRVETITAS